VLIIQENDFVENVFRTEDAIGEVEDDVLAFLRQAVSSRVVEKPLVFDEIEVASSIDAV